MPLTLHTFFRNFPEVSPAKDIIIHFLKQITRLLIRHPLGSTPLKPEHFLVITGKGLPEIKLTPILQQESENRDSFSREQVLTGFAQFLKDILLLWRDKYPQVEKTKEYALIATLALIISENPTFPLGSIFHILDQSQKIPTDFTGLKENQKKEYLLKFAVVAPSLPKSMDKDSATLIPALVWEPLKEKTSQIIHNNVAGGQDVLLLQAPDDQLQLECVRQIQNRFAKSATVIVSLDENDAEISILGTIDRLFQSKAPDAGLSAILKEMGESLAILLPAMPHLAAWLKENKTDTTFSIKKSQWQAAFQKLLRTIALQMPVVVIIPHADKTSKNLIWLESLLVNPGGKITLICLVSDKPNDKLETKDNLSEMNVLSQLLSPLFKRPYVIHQELPLYDEPTLSYFVEVECGLERFRIDENEKSRFYVSVLKETGGNPVKVHMVMEKLFQGLAGVDLTKPAEKAYKTDCLQVFHENGQYHLKIITESLTILLERINMTYTALESRTRAQTIIVSEQKARQAEINLNCVDAALYYRNQLFSSRSHTSTERKELVLHFLRNAHDARLMTLEQDINALLKTESDPIIKAHLMAVQAEILQDNVEKTLDALTLLIQGFDLVRNMSTPHIKELKPEYHDLNLLKSLLSYKTADMLDKIWPFLDDIYSGFTWQTTDQSPEFKRYIEEKINERPEMKQIREESKTPILEMAASFVLRQYLLETRELGVKLSLPKTQDAKRHFLDTLLTSPALGEHIAHLGSTMIRKNHVEERMKKALIHYPHINSEDNLKVGVRWILAAISSTKSEVSMDSLIKECLSWLEANQIKIRLLNLFIVLSFTRKDPTTGIAAIFHMIPVIMEGYLTKDIMFWFTLISAAKGTFIELEHIPLLLNGKGKTTNVEPFYHIARAFDLYHKDPDLTVLAGISLFMVGHWYEGPAAKETSSQVRRFRETCQIASDTLLNTIAFQGIAPFIRYGSGTVPDMIRQLEEIYASKNRFNAGFILDNLAWYLLPLIELLYRDRDRKNLILEKMNAPMALEGSLGSAKKIKKAVQTLFPDMEMKKGEVLSIEEIDRKFTLEQQLAFYQYAHSNNDSTAEYMVNKSLAYCMAEEYSHALTLVQQFFDKKFDQNLLGSIFMSEILFVWGVAQYELAITTGNGKHLKNDPIKKLHIYAQLPKSFINQYRYAVVMALKYEWKAVQKPHSSHQFTALEWFYKAEKLEQHASRVEIPFVRLLKMKCWKRLEGAQSLISASLIGKVEEMYGGLLAEGAIERLEKGYKSLLTTSRLSFDQRAFEKQLASPQKTEETVKLFLDTLWRCFPLERLYLVREGSDPNFPVICYKNERTQVHLKIPVAEAAKEAFSHFSTHPDAEFFSRLISKENGIRRVIRIVAFPFIGHMIYFEADGGILEKNDISVNQILHWKTLLEVGILNDKLKRCLQSASVEKQLNWSLQDSSTELSESEHSLDSSVQEFQMKFEFSSHSSEASLSRQNSVAIFQSGLSEPTVLSSETSAAFLMRKINESIRTSKGQTVLSDVFKLLQRAFTLSLQQHFKEVMDIYNTALTLSEPYPLLSGVVRELQGHQLDSHFPDATNICFKEAMRHYHVAGCWQRIKDLQALKGADISLIEPDNRSAEKMKGMRPIVGRLLGHGISDILSEDKVSQEKHIMTLITDIVTDLKPYSVVIVTDVDMTNSRCRQTIGVSYTPETIPLAFKKDCDGFDFPLTLIHRALTTGKPVEIIGNLNTIRDDYFRVSNVKVTRHPESLFIIPLDEKNVLFVKSAVNSIEEKQAAMEKILASAQLLKILGLLSNVYFVTMIYNQLLENNLDTITADPLQVLALLKHLDRLHRDMEKKMGLNPGKGAMNTLSKAVVTRLLAMAFDAGKYDLAYALIASSVNSNEFHKITDFIMDSRYETVILEQTFSEPKLWEWDTKQGSLGVRLLAQIELQHIRETSDLETLNRSDFIYTKGITKFFDHMPDVSFIKKPIIDLYQKIPQDMKYDELKKETLSEDGNRTFYTMQSLCEGFLSELFSLPLPKPVNDFFVMIFSESFTRVIAEKLNMTKQDAMTVLRVQKMIAADFFFLRFLNPRLTQPLKTNIFNESMTGMAQDPQRQRGVIIISKIIQNIANHNEAINTEMTWFNPFIKRYYQKLDEFYQKFMDANRTH